MTSIGTLYRTVCHLRLRQVIGRARFRLQRPRLNLAPPPERRAPGSWAMPACRHGILMPPARLRMLNLPYDIDQLGWDNPGVDRLLRYNAHYFDDLCAAGASSRAAAQRALVSRWIAENPPARGTGWEPYPLSLRLVNWIKWFLGGERAEPAWEHSLAVQARWLRGRLEYHLLGNHLFANAKALVFAGSYFSGPEADEWRRLGLSILAEEVPEQILADGGQFERSPMYHAIALEDLLDLINLSRASSPPPIADAVVAQWRRVASDMLHWLRCMSHSDTELALFNDCADDIAPSLAELERYAGALGIGAAPPSAEAMTSLPVSGYVRAARGPMLAILDVAPIGPDYLPGHAHADTLSFELTLRGRRIVVNGGTSRYGVSPERLAERGTAAHSTVQVAGADSSEVWSGFRVGRRARVGVPRVEGWKVECSHDGYRYLPGRPIHRRRWEFAAQGMNVEDTVLGGHEPAVARYLFAPGLRLEQQSTREWSVAGETGTLARVEIVRGTARAARSRHSRHFGETHEVACLEVDLASDGAVTRWTWDSNAHPVSH